MKFSNLLLIISFFTISLSLPVHGSGWWKSAAELQAEQEAKAAEEAKKRGFWNKVFNTFGRKTQTETLKKEETAKAGAGVWAKLFSRKQEVKPVEQPKRGLLERLFGRRSQDSVPAQIQLSQVPVREQELHTELLPAEQAQKTRLLRSGLNVPEKASYIELLPADQPQKAGFFRSLFHRRQQEVVEPEIPVEDIRVEKPQSQSKGWFSWFRGSPSQALAGNVAGENSTIPGAYVKKMVGETPKEFKFLIENLKDCNAEMQKKGSKKDGLFTDRMLLYGPPGNGKSTWAAEIARLSGAEFMSAMGSTVVGSFVGEGSKNVNALFVSAIEKGQKAKKPVVLFIDEFDAFADKKFATDNKAGTGAQEYTNAAKTMWGCMDKIRNEKLPIVVILATNLELKDIDRRIINRFDGFNTVEIKNPNKKDREEILKHYLGQSLPEVARQRILGDSGLMRALTSQSENMSVRQLENFARTCRIELTINNRDPQSLTKAVLLKLLLDNKKKVSADVETYAEKMKRKYQTEMDVMHGVNGAAGMFDGVFGLPLRLYHTYDGYRDLLGMRSR